MDTPSPKRPNLSILNSPWTLIGIFILALTLRLIYVFQLKDSPLFGFFAMDSFHFDAFALEILKGKLLFDDLIYLNSLYTVILSIIYFVFNCSQLTVLVIQALTDSLTCLLIYYIGMKAFSKRSVGLLASFIYACYVAAIFYTGFLLDTSLAGFFVALLAAIILFASDRNKNWPWAICGLIFGLSALLRPNIVIVLPFFVLWFYFCKGISFKTKTIRLFLVFLGMFILFLPFSVRNFMIAKSPSPFGVQGGFTFYVGNHEGAHGGGQIPEGISPAPVESTKQSIAIASKDSGKKLSPSEASRYWFLKGCAFIKNNPREYAQLMLRKFFLFWHSAEVESNVNFYFTKTHIPVLNLPLFYFGFIGPFAMMGILLSLRGINKNLMLVMLFIIAYMLSVIIFCVTSRYRFPPIPLLAVMASFAIHNLATLIAAKKIRITALFLFALFVLYIMTHNYPFRLNPSHIDEISDYPSSHMNLGVNYKKRGMIEEAVAEYKRALELNPNYAEAFYNLGVIYTERDMISEAISHYKKAINSDPGFGPPRYDLGNLYFKKGMVKEAIAEYKKALEINPHYTDAYYNMGVIHADQGDIDSAIDYYKQALEVSPKYTFAYNNLGGIYISKGMLDEAISAFQKVIELTPDYLIAYDNLAIAYRQKGEVDKAIAQYKKTLEIDPNYMQAYYRLGVLYTEKGMRDEAMAEYKKGIEVDPNSEKIRKNLAQMYFENGDFDKAIAECERVLEIDPKDAEAQYNLALCYFRIGNLEKAIFNCDKAIENGFNANPEFLELLRPYRPK